MIKEKFECEYMIDPMFVKQHYPDINFRNLDDVIKNRNAIDN
jgi:hypothetical protein